ncbi:MAG: biotin-independent malonate decarboxylase subunit beta [Verrucomicrobia bacterium]|nr:biotin-independent malonate decarboxylase subunit beta [Verrucomicrobiota bacterium]
MNAPQTVDPQRFRARKSIIELSARECVQALLDVGTFHELLGPFERLDSPWLGMQGIVPQSDDGVVVARGKIGGINSVVIGIEGKFQGGSIGEVSGAKIATALDLAHQDAEQGRPVHAVLLFETGGVRLQEANLGLEAIAEINSSLLGMREHVPVVGVITGMVGCFGGMAITASLCSYLIMTRQGRLGLNGPEVIEEQSGVEEFDSRDRRLIWSVTGGEQRYVTKFADYLADDDVDDVRRFILDSFGRGIPPIHRSERIDYYLDRLGAIDVSRQLESADVQKLFV